MDHLGTALTVWVGYVYVSTAQARSASWEEARQVAIDRMLAIDASRQIREGDRSTAMGQHETAVSVTSWIGMSVAAVLLGAVIFTQLDGPVGVALIISGGGGLLGALAGWSLIAGAYDAVRKRW